MTPSSNEANIAGRVMRGAAWIGVTRLAIAALGFVSTILLARLLLPEDFGLVAIAQTFIILLAVISELSLGAALIQLDRVEEEHYHTAFTLGLVRSTALSVLIAALAFPISKLYGDPRLAPIILFLALSNLVSGLYNPKMFTFARQLSFAPQMLMGFSGKVVGFIVGVTCAFVFRSYWALVLGAGAAQLTQAIVGYMLVLYRPRISISRWKDLLSFSIWMTASNWVQTLNWRADPLILGFFVPVTDLGQYSMAARVTNIATQELTAPLAQVLFPAFSRMKHEADRLRSAYMKSISILSFVAMPTAIGLAVLAEPIIALTLGEKWLPMTIYLQIIAATAALKYTENVSPIAMAIGHTRALFGRDLRALAIRAPLLIGGIYIGATTSIGIIAGAMIGRAIARGVNAVWNMTLIRRITKVTIRDHLSAIGRPICATILMGSAVWWLHSVAASSGAIEWIELFMLVGTGVMIYLVTSLLLWVASGCPDGPESAGLTIVAQLKSWTVKRLRSRR